MIIIGYQGIGKSTLSNKNIKYVDLESGNFYIDKKRQDNWYLIYCNIAKHLSSQGKNVFISSHEVVRKELENTSEKVIIVYPSLELKGKWVQKLQERYNITNLDKDYKALMNAKQNYDENIKELQNNNFIKIEINDIDYNLECLLEDEEEE